MNGLMAYVLGFKKSKAYTDTAIAGLGSGMKYQGNVSTYNDLPVSGNKKGYVYTVASNGAEYVWTKSTATGSLSDWQQLGSSLEYEEIYTVPSKGQKITLNLDGTDRYFRVLNVNGTNAEVVGLFNASQSLAFGTDQIYAGSTLDTFLNQTWYGELTSAAKTAIVDKTFTQDMWYFSDSGNPDYSGYKGLTNPGDTAYTVSLSNASFGESITRHVYALSMQDILNYVTDTSFGRDGLLQNYNIWKMLWDDEVAHTNENIWLRSASQELTERGWNVIGDNGSLTRIPYDNTALVLPALTIDLSKISWS